MTSKELNYGDECSLGEKKTCVKLTIRLEASLSVGCDCNPSHSENMKRKTKEDLPHRVKSCITMLIVCLLCDIVHLKMQQTESCNAFRTLSKR